MVSVGFTVCRDKILRGEKQTTIREPRKREWKDGDILNLFWGLRTEFCYRLFDVPLERIERIKLNDLTEEIALADGFTSLDECLSWFKNTHTKYIESDKYKGFDRLHWDFQKRFNVTPIPEMMKVECKRLESAFMQTFGIAIVCKPTQLTGVDIEILSKNISNISDVKGNSVLISLKI